MQSVFRGLAVFLMLMVIFRLAGKRTLHQTTTFDLVLLLIISETVQQAMIDNDNSFTNAFVLVSTLIGLNVLFSVVKQRSVFFQRVTEGTPVVLMENGQPQRESLKKERVDNDDILHAARLCHGLERMEDVKHAVLERDGAISIVPREDKL